jgi:hypothetical protein
MSLPFLFSVLSLQNKIRRTHVAPCVKIILFIQWYTQITTQRNKTKQNNNNNSGKSYVEAILLFLSICHIVSECVMALCSFFWVIPLFLNCLCRRFGTLWCYNFIGRVDTAYGDGKECFETSAHKILTPGNHPKKVQHSQYGESLKSRIMYAVRELLANAKAELFVHKAGQFLF